MNNKKMTNNEVETIYTLTEHGVQQKTVAELCSCSSSQVSAINVIAKYAKDGDVENLKREAKPHGTIVRWACEKWDVKLNETVKTEQPKQPKQKQSTNDDLLLQTLGELLQEIKRLNEQLVKLG